MARIHRLTAAILPLAALIGIFGCNFFLGKSAGEAVAARIHAQVQQKDYSAIYNEASAGFKQTAPESDFIEFMQNYSSKTGAFKQATQVAWEIGVDATAGKMYTFVYELEFENGTVREKLVFSRSEQGKMQLRSLQWSPVQRKAKPTERPPQTTVS
jgi:hypothetical protein